MKRQMGPFLVMALLLGACTIRRQPFERTIYEGLAVSQITYKHTLETAADANRKGLLKNEQLEKVIEIAKKHQTTHNLILTLTHEYVKNKQAGKDVSDLGLRITALSQSLNAIILELIEVSKAFGGSP